MGKQISNSGGKIPLVIGYR